MNVQFLSTPIGILCLSASESALTEVARVSAAGKGLPNAVTEEAAGQLEEYFRKKRQEFSIALAPQGTPFQQRVWEALAQIPYGQTRTYGQIAAEIGKPRACRAVGTAIGKNPLLILIPCHRVVSVGGLGGFSAGLDAKRSLLALESGFPGKKT